MINMKTLLTFGTRSRIKTAILALSALAAGIVNGFLGTGGGIVLMLSLGALAKKADPRDLFAQVISVILPLSLVSALIYKNITDTASASPYIVPGILGGLAGAMLLDKINVSVLKKLFAAAVIWAGINMIF